MSTVYSPKGLRISDEVHKALRVRAAETGETMGEIAERALRRELGMTKYVGYTISTGFLAGNLFHDSSDEGGTYDEAESAAKYAEMCKEAIEREYPGATVEVDYQLNASGSTPATLQTLVVEAEDADPADNDQIAEHVDRICEQVWESWEWVVYEKQLTWQVIEDNGGGLHLVVFEGDSVVYYGNGYEHNETGLRADLEALRNGDDPREGWEMHTDDPQGAYDALTSHESGWEVVADEDSAR